MQQSSKVPPLRPASHTHKTRFRMPVKNTMNDPDIPAIDDDEAQVEAAESPNTWRKWRDKRVRQPQTTVTKLKMRDRRRMREKRRTSGGSGMPSTEGTTSGEEEENGEAPHTTTVTVVNNRSENSISSMQQEYKGPSSHVPLTKRLSPAAALLGKFRGSKSQSDLDADCEDNTADYDSASMISASEMCAANASYALGHQHSSQFFIPAPSADACFQAHVQEIRVAGMQQLAAADGQATDEALSASSSSEAIPEAVVAEVDSVGRIAQLERLVQDLSKRVRETDLENEQLRAENKALLKAVQQFKSANS